MKKNAVQKELFKDFEVSKKRKKASYDAPFKNYTPFNISYENSIFIAIAFIMVMVFIFSLGVERGRRLALGPIKKEVVKIQVPPPEKLDIGYTRKEEVKEIEDKKIEDRKIEAAEDIVYESGSMPIIEKPKLLTIQLVAYRSKKLAQKELAKLRKKGYKPFIIIGGGYYQICAGEYRNKKELEKDLLGLRKSYKDSFVRKR